MHPSLEQALGFYQSISALGEASALCGWDQQVMMPKGAAAARAHLSSQLEALSHERFTDGRFADLLDACEGNAPSDEERAQLRLMRRELDQRVHVPKDLAVAIAKETAKAMGVWEEARANNDFESFLPTLQTVVKLQQERGDALAQGGDRYDALVDLYEPDTPSFVLDQMFDQLAPELTQLLASIAAKSPDSPSLGEHFDADEQLAFSHAVCEWMGYDFGSGRLDRSTHPFTTSFHPTDVRITTRVQDDDFCYCLYSTIHEAGHALYEQGLPTSLYPGPACRAVSMGVHESQSRLWENQLARGEDFGGFLYAQARERFSFGVESASAFYRAINHVKASHIRTEADEVTYNLHIILRYRLEKQLIEGSLPAADLPGAWADQSNELLGLTPPDHAHGVLQDVHWAVGAFGYFPTYTLGNVYAAELHAAMRRDIPDMDAHLSRGKTQPMITWLRTKIHQYGSTVPAQELIAQAVGHTPTSTPLITYLQSKFGALYNLT